MVAVSRAQRVALVALFTSLAIILNFAVSIPAPYAGFLNYEIWEVPVLAAVLLLGVGNGVSVAVLNTLVLELHPGVLPTGPVYNLIAELAMIAGVVAAQWVALKVRTGLPLTWVMATASAAVLRTGVMTVVNAAVLPQPYPVGFSLPPEAVAPTLVVIGIFNFTLTLYTVPLGFSVARAVRSRYPRYFASAHATRPEPFTP